jgi:hypothetical protein
MIQTKFNHRFGSGKIIPAHGGGFVVIGNSNVPLSGSHPNDGRASEFKRAITDFAVENGLGPDRVVITQGV